MSTEAGTEAIDLTALGEELGFDLTAEIPCSGAGSGEGECPRPARWRLHLKVCGHIVFVCSEHRRDAEMRAGGLPWHQELALVHDDCGILNTKWTWSAL